MEDFTKELVSFMSEEGFIWGPEPEIYGGLAGFYSYAPMGKLLKNNVEDAIRNVFMKNDFWEVECPTVMPTKVWEASGHLSSFTDPMIKTEKGNDYRVDHLIEEQTGATFEFAKLSEQEILDLLKKHNIKAPDGSKFVPKIINHSLMMRTTVGLDTEAYNRPETATTTYLPFKRYAEFFRKKIPFGVFQIGKAYRNEISPRQHVLRCREFTQAEAQIFILPRQKEGFEKFDKISTLTVPLIHHTFDKIEKISLTEALERGYLKNKVYAYALGLAYQLFLEMGIPGDKIRIRQHHPDEMAFYADDAWDLEVNLKSFGWMECCGIHDRTNYDLSQHAKHSGESMEFHDEETKEKLIPHIIEIAFGTDRPTFALLDLFYDNTDKQKRVLRLPTRLAPVKAAIFPLVNKEKLPEFAEKIHERLSKHAQCIYDKSGSIGRRYARQDEKGTPYCITIDFDSLSRNDVTLRERDSQEQIRISLDYLYEVFPKLVEGELTFEDIS